MEPTSDRTVTITARISEALNGEFEALARDAGCKKDELIAEALRRFLEIERRQIALIEDRVRQADAGNFATDAEVARVYAKFNVRRREQSARVAG